MCLMIYQHLGLTPCSTDVLLKVDVLEQSAPRFKRQEYSVTVPENLPPHSLLPLKVTAEAPYNHPVMYSVVEDKTSSFSVDVTAGMSYRCFLSN